MEKERTYFSPVQNRKARVAIVGTLAGLGLIAGAAQKIANVVSPGRLKEHPVTSQVEEFDSAKREEEMAHAYDLEDARNIGAVISCERLEDKVEGISEAGLDLVKKFEGFSAMPYKCPAGKETIGYGHVIRESEEFDGISNDGAKKLLREDMRFAEEAVRKYVDVELDQSQFDALASFSYNVGIGAFRKSTLLKKLNSGDYSGAAEEFSRWNKSKGKVLPGLVKRRAAERGCFLINYFSK